MISLGIVAAGIQIYAKVAKEKFSDFPAILQRITDYCTLLHSLAPIHKILTDPQGNYREFQYLPSPIPEYRSIFCSLL